VSRASRRRFLKLATSAAVLPAVSPRPSALAVQAAAAEIADGDLQVSFDARMRSRITQRRAGGVMRLTDWSQGQWLVPKGGAHLKDFVLAHHERESIDGPHGRGVRLTLIGVSAATAPRVEKTVQVSLFERYPGFAFWQSRYRNLGTAPLAVTAWHDADLTLRSATDRRDEVQFWSFCGSSHADRRDWVQPVRAGF
jgi:alpha-galactosidase